MRRKLSSQKIKNKEGDRKRKVLMQVAKGYTTKRNWCIRGHCFGAV